MLVHFGERGPAGTSSSYDDWRNHVLRELDQNNMMDVVADNDHVIGLEGLTLG